MAKGDRSVAFFMGADQRAEYFSTSTGDKARVGARRLKL
ncbi:hypothetical protein C4K04_1009 [Pseudomonas chlororaphis]|uniref:Uncharacterized protein n=1 Tax=Pseudomonas chlororaphis TaxID=587753 RepID=A0A3G7TIJ3_9PSED|nr:hypothetical protein C4K04_1009 [Pseudomonas chlororaphis]